MQTYIYTYVLLIKVAVSGRTGLNILQQALSVSAGVKMAIIEACSNIGRLVPKANKQQHTIKLTVACNSELSVPTQPTSHLSWARILMPDNFFGWSTLHWQRMS